MIKMSVISLLVTFMVCLVCEAVPSSSTLSHFQPMIAIVCAGKNRYHNQYLDENKRWISDPDPKATCFKDKLEILEYCRKVYPKRDIRNIVEYSKYMPIDNWCRVGQSCGYRRFVKPYRCLEGPFQSDALLVPAYCLFDHIHNGSLCQSSDYWNKTATASCVEKRAMQLKSFGMLLPCGVGIFSGVEFVCCPSNMAPTENTAKDTHIESQINYKDSDDADSDENTDDSDAKNNNDDDDDEYYDDYSDDDDGFSSVSKKASTSTTSTTTTTTTTTTTEKPIDHYLSHFDSNHEHDSYKLAQKSLEENHRDKVTRVMKEWSELEERYQAMKLKDPKEAAEFKRKMTARFQKTVEALEEEGSAERRQLVSMHQQRVMTVINMRKKAAMDCYTQSLDQTPLKTKRIEKCLEKLLRALEKDRTHTLHHFRHLLNSNTVQALREKNTILDHLENLLRMANHSISMLDKVPSISSKIKTRIVAFWHNLRGISPDEAINRQIEQAIVERYEEEVAQKQQEKERLKLLKEEREQELKDMEEERKRAENNNQKAAKLDTEFDQDSNEDDRREKVKQVEGEEPESSYNRPISDSPISSLNTEPPATSSNNNADSFVHEDNSENVNIHKILPTPKVAHIHNQGLHHDEMASTILKEPYNPIKWNGSVYITLAFAGIALLMASVVGIVLLRSHRQRSPLSQGFVEVDQAASPEERHVANMQINGYENPTFKYFEAQNT